MVTQVSKKSSVNKSEFEKSLAHDCKTNYIWLLEKYENLLELSVKQLVIQSSLESLISQCLVREKPNVNVVYSKVRYFSDVTKDFQV